MLEKIISTCYASTSPKLMELLAGEGFNVICCNTLNQIKEEATSSSGGSLIIIDDTTTFNPEAIGQLSEEISAASKIVILSSSENKDNYLYLMYGAETLITEPNAIYQILAYINKFQQNALSRKKFSTNDNMIDDHYITVLRGAATICKSDTSGLLTFGDHRIIKAAKEMERQAQKILKILESSESENAFRPNYVLASSNYLLKQIGAAIPSACRNKILIRSDNYKFTMRTDEELFLREIVGLISRISEKNIQTLANISVLMIIDHYPLIDGSVQFSLYCPHLTNSIESSDTKQMITSFDYMGIECEFHQLVRSCLITITFPPYSVVD